MVWGMSTKPKRKEEPRAKANPMIRVVGVRMSEDLWQKLDRALQREIVRAPYRTITAADLIREMLAQNL